MGYGKGQQKDPHYAWNLEPFKRKYSFLHVWLLWEIDEGKCLCKLFLSFLFAGYSILQLMLCIMQDDTKLYELLILILQFLFYAYIWFFVLSTSIANTCIVRQTSLVHIFLELDIVTHTKSRLLVRTGRTHYFTPISFPIMTASEQLLLLLKVFNGTLSIIM